MRNVIHYVIGLVLLCAPVGCRSLAPFSQPILARGDGTLPAEETAAQDLQSCRTEAQKAAPQTMQPRWLPPFGSSQNGAVLGTADFPHAVWPSGETYRQAIERCLTAHGYTVRGWQ